MENKYYTPKIEEFHVGFEYQYAKNFMDGTVKTKEEFDNATWIDETLIVNNALPYIERALNGTNASSGFCGIRVKYLDQEDLDELGWEVIKEP